MTPNAKLTDVARALAGPSGRSANGRGAIVGLAIVGGSLYFIYRDIIAALLFSNFTPGGKLFRTVVFKL